MDDRIRHRLGDGERDVGLEPAIGAVGRGHLGDPAARFADRLGQRFAVERDVGDVEAHAIGNYPGSASRIPRIGALGNGAGLAAFDDDQKPSAAVDDVLGWTLVAAHDEEASRVGPDLLVLAQRELDQFVASEPRAFAYERDEALAGHPPDLDRLVDQPERRLIASEPPRLSVLHYGASLRGRDIWQSRRIPAIVVKHAAAGRERPEASPSRRASARRSRSSMPCSFST